jgi:hypothetical protein
MLVERCTLGEASRLYSFRVILQRRRRRRPTAADRRIWPKYLSFLTLIV